jgi:fumarate reductase subunit D
MGKYVEIKCQLDTTDEFLLQTLLLAQHVSGHRYAHHQELEGIIQVVAACRIWCFGFQVVGMVWS